MQGVHSPPENRLDEHKAIYSAIDNYNQRLQERQQLSVTQQKEVADALQIQNESDRQKQNMISSLSNYATNVKYVNLNGNLHPNINVSVANHPISPDECDVYHSLVDKVPTSTIDVMPNHCISDDGTMQGFKFTCNGSDKSNCLPMQRKMFFRTSMLECKTRGTECTNTEALSLISNQRNVRDRLLNVMQSVYKKSIGNEASFACMSDNIDENSSKFNSNAIIGTYMNRKAADCVDWSPEIPETVGLYHSYVRGFNRDQRLHKLFIIVSGGCDKICDSYFNLSLDVGNDMTTKEVFESEETWYLKRINQRNNARIALQVAQEFSLPISTSVDPYSYDPGRFTLNPKPFIPNPNYNKPYTTTGEIACMTSETLHYDLTSNGSNKYSLLNKCVQTSTSRNGILFNMHAAEGIWIFKGPLQTSLTSMPYGGSFGNRNHSTCFPICTHMLHANYSWSCTPVKSSPCVGKPCIVMPHVSPAVCYINEQCQELQLQSSIKHHTNKSTYVDECYVNNLQNTHEWNRDNGIVELIPIAVISQKSYK
jgi:hypothetical protein